MTPGHGIHVVAKPIGPAYNLNCAYCFYLEKEALFDPGERYRMPDEVLETGDVGVHDEEAYPDETLVTGRLIDGSAAMRAQTAAAKPAEPVDD